MTAPRPWALRLASTDNPREDKAAELARLVGQPVSIVVEQKIRDPDEIARIAGDLGAVAVLADSFPGDLDVLRRTVAPVPVLRPMFKPPPGEHAGAPQTRFSCYGLLGDDGQLARLPDGALAP